VKPSGASSEEIARKSRSNLAFALACLPKERRRDMVSFYAYCRIVDDIADADDRPVEGRRGELARWRHAVRNDGAGVEDPVLSEVVKLPQKYAFSPDWLVEVIDGCATDLDKIRYRDIEDLLGYCYKVASVVGLVSARIFGANCLECDAYAVDLGYAFQLTNIMRDVGQDARETGRIYLPQDELARFGVSEDAILEGRREQGFTALMEHQYQRAQAYYAKARAALPAEAKGTMIAARMMDAIYSRILEQMHATGYQTLVRRERLSKLKKAGILAGFLLESTGRRLVGA
jgi:phytoene synthase